jgi:N-dimethylarginine dimethylaminohydrolase
MKINIQDEFSRLRAVLLGTAKSNGPDPEVADCYDPKSKQHVLAGTYPKEEDMIVEMEAVAAVFKKYDVTVYRPEVVENYNQIFCRDIAFCIEDKIIKANILPDREKEYAAMSHVLNQIAPKNIIELPEECHVEGGDVMPWGDYIFIGTYSGADYASYITARTNIDAVIAIQELFPDKIVKSFELRKDNDDPKENALHLDCCFQPLGQGKAILYKNGFLIESEYQWLVDFFGEEHIFEITKDEMYNMNSNVFSIAEDVVISEANFTRLNAWLRENGFTVEEVPYAEIAKQEGLLRCSTMPLIRDASH